DTGRPGRIHDQAGPGHQGHGQPAARSRRPAGAPRLAPDRRPGHLAAALPFHTSQVVLPTRFRAAYGDRSWIGARSGTAMSIRFKSLLFVAYVIAGIVIAWEHSYLTLAWLKTLISALLAIFLWWLVLLGVNLHVH